uniref:hypothetical protein n=1 Tax=Agrobacterium pusense TaxID=648995 RepID=UPI001AECC0B3
MSSQSSGKLPRNYNLDMLRGLAAVCVAYSHLALKMHNRGDTDGVVILPVLTGFSGRTHAAIF